MICRTLRKLLKCITTVCQCVNWLSELLDMKIIPGHNYFVHGQESYCEWFAHNFEFVNVRLNKLCMLHTSIQIKKHYTENEKCVFLWPLCKATALNIECAWRATRCTDMSQHCRLNPVWALNVRLRWKTKEVAENSQKRMQSRQTLWGVVTGGEKGLHSLIMGIVGFFSEIV